MYRLNQLHRNVLITVDEVIFHAATEGTIDPRRIQQSIIIAEERVIRPALCFEFYEALRAEKNQVVTSGNKAAMEALINAEIVTPITLEVGDIVNSSSFLSTANKLLWNEYLWKLTAEAVMFIAVPKNFMAFTSQGILHNKPTIAGFNGEGSVTPDLATVKWAVDKALFDSVEPLIGAMHQWICKYQTNYSAYCKTCNCDENGVPAGRKTDFILNIYDDDEDSCGCN